MNRWSAWSWDSTESIPVAAQPSPEPCRDCSGHGWTDWNRDVDGGSCPRCGGAGVEGGYAALREVAA